VLKRVPLHPVRGFISLARVVLAAICFVLLIPSCALVMVAVAIAFCMVGVMFMGTGCVLVLGATLIGATVGITIGPLLIVSAGSLLFRGNLQWPAAYCRAVIESPPVYLIGALLAGCMEAIGGLGDKTFDFVDGAVDLIEELLLEPLAGNAVYQLEQAVG